MRPGSARRCCPDCCSLVSPARSHVCLILWSAGYPRGASPSGDPESFVLEVIAAWPRYMAAQWGSSIGYCSVSSLPRP